MKAVLLDIDGTLLDSNRFHAASWSDALREFGYDIPAERVLPLIGMGGDKLMDELVPGMKPDDGAKGEQIAIKRMEVFKSRYLQHCKPTRGARDLLLELRRRGLRLVVATSAKGDELKDLLQAARVDDLIEGAATSDDAAGSKPDPDIVRAALKKSGVKPTEAIMLGDTPYDVEAAHKAGVRIIAVRCGGWAEPRLLAEGVYDDPAQILAFLTSASDHASLKSMLA